MTMSATISTEHRRVPLATALAIAGVIVAGGALGFAWEQSHDSTAPAQAPAPPVQAHVKNVPYYGPNAQSIQAHHPASGGNSRSIERYQTYPGS